MEPLTTEVIQPDQQLQEPFLRVFKNEYLGANIGHKLALAVGSLAVGAHLAVADLLYANVGVDTFLDTKGNYLATGVAIAATSVVVETMSTFFVSNAIDKFPKTAKWLYERKYKTAEDELPVVSEASEDESGIIDLLKDEFSQEQANIKITTPAVETDKKHSLLKFGKKNIVVDPKDITVLDKKSKDEPSKYDTASTVLFLGSPGYILQENNRDPADNRRANFLRGAKAIGGLAVFNFSVFTGVAAAVKYGAEIGPFADKLLVTGFGSEPYIEHVVPTGILPALKSPELFASLFGISRLLKYRKNRKEAKDVPSRVVTEVIPNN
jgi:hypothetical protein